MLPPPPRSTLFPYTTLFRSAQGSVYDRTLALDLANHGQDVARALDLANAEIAVRKDVYGYDALRSEEHTSELQSHVNLVCRLLLEKKKKKLEYSCHSFTYNN